MKYLLFTLLSAVTTFSQAEIFCQSQVAEAASSKFSELAHSRFDVSTSTLQGIFIDSVSGVQGFIAAPNEISTQFDVETYSVDGEFSIKSLTLDQVQNNQVAATVYTKANTCEVVSVLAKVTQVSNDD